MPAESAPIDDYSDSAAYRWVIRGLYVTAIGLNVWILWKANAGDVETAIVKAKARAWWKKTTRPALIARDWRKALNRMHFEVAQTLEAATVAPESEPPDARP